MWCKNNNCCYYDKDNNKCIRIGENGINKDKKSICWIDRSEGEY